MHIEQQFPGTQAMFITGCGADANPYPRRTTALARQHGRTLGIEVCRVLDGELEPIRGALRTAYAEPSVPLDPYQSREQAQELGRQFGFLRSSVEKAVAAFDHGESLPTNYAVPVSVWQLGNKLTLVALSGETVVDYVRLSEQVLGPLALWVAGYSNDVFGYLPSARVLAEGGYETKGLSRGGVGRFAPEAETVIMETIQALAASVGRPKVAPVEW
jgi:hypothetical protein